MKSRLIITLIAPAFLFFALPRVAAQNTRAVDAEDARLQARSRQLGEMHVYKTVDGRDLHLFVVKPADWKSADKRPAIVFFHGGSWTMGSPTQFNAQADYFASRGLIGIQVEYRLVANNHKEAPLVSCEDAKSAMRWVRSHAVELGVDPSRIAAAGGSAGGQLAAFVGMVEGTDDPHDDLKVSCKPEAMLLYNPALLGELVTSAERGLEQGAAAPARVAGVTREVVEAYRKISPLLNVAPGAPPGIIVVGDRDTVLPPSELKEFRERCDKAGDRMEAVVYPGEGHSFFGINRSKDRFYDTTTEMDKFLGTLGWMQGPPTLTRDTVNALASEVAQDANRSGSPKESPAAVETPKQEPSPNSN